MLVSLGTHVAWIGMQKADEQSAAQGTVCVGASPGVNSGRGSLEVKSLP